MSTHPWQCSAHTNTCLSTVALIFLYLPFFQRNNKSSNRSYFKRECVWNCTRITREFERSFVHETFQGAPERPCCLWLTVSVGEITSTQSPTHHSVNCWKFPTVWHAMGQAKLTSSVSASIWFEGWITSRATARRFEYTRAMEKSGCHWWRWIGNECREFQFA